MIVREGLRWLESFIAQAPSLGAVRCIYARVCLAALFAIFPTGLFARVLPGDFVAPTDARSQFPKR